MSSDGFVGLHLRIELIVPTRLVEDDDRRSWLRRSRGIAWGEERERRRRGRPASRVVGDGPLVLGSLAVIRWSRSLA